MCEQTSILQMFWLNKAAVLRWIFKWDDIRLIERLKFVRAITNKHTYEMQRSCDIKLLRYSWYNLIMI